MASKAVCGRGKVIAGGHDDLWALSRYLGTAGVPQNGRCLQYSGIWGWQQTREAERGDGSLHAGPGGERGLVLGLGAEGAMQHRCYDALLLHLREGEPGQRMEGFGGEMQKLGWVVWTRKRAAMAEALAVTFQAARPLCLHCSVVTDTLAPRLPSSPLSLLSGTPVSTCCALHTLLFPTVRPPGGAHLAPGPREFLCMRGARLYLPQTS